MTWVNPVEAKEKVRELPDPKLPFTGPSTYRFVVTPCGNPWADTVTLYDSCPLAVGMNARLVKLSRSRSPIAKRNS